MMREPINQYLRVQDPLTKGFIYCCHSNHLQTPGWRQNYLYSSSIEQVDVRTLIPFNSKKAFTFDSYVAPKNVHQFVCMLIDYACLLHIHLIRDGNVIVNCKNGRSRSPTVILAFMMLRGLKQNHATTWLRHAFQTQRPYITQRSAQFPNFQKFFNVLNNLEQMIQLNSSNQFITSRVLNNMVTTQPRSVNEKYFYHYMHGTKPTSLDGSLVPIFDNTKIEEDNELLEIVPSPSSLPISSEAKKGKRKVGSMKSPEIHIQLKKIPCGNNSSCNGYLYVQEIYTVGDGIWSCDICQISYKEDRACCTKYPRCLYKICGICAKQQEFDFFKKKTSKKPSSSKVTDEMLIEAMKINIAEALRLLNNSASNSPSIKGKSPPPPSSNSKSSSSCSSCSSTSSSENNSDDDDDDDYDDNDDDDNNGNDKNNDNNDDKSKSHRIIIIGDDNVKVEHNGAFLVLPAGWKKQSHEQGTAAKRDTFFLDPQGKRYRSVAEVEIALGLRINNIPASKITNKKKRKVTSIEGVVPSKISNKTPATFKIKKKRKVISIEGVVGNNVDRRPTKKSLTTSQKVKIMDAAKIIETKVSSALKALTDSDLLRKSKVWHSTVDESIRKEVKRRIFQMVHKKIFNITIANKVAELSEFSLYSTAATRNDYMNLDTIDTRMRQLRGRFGEIEKEKGSSNRSIQKNRNKTKSRSSSSSSNINNSDTNIAKTMLSLSFSPSSLAAVDLKQLAQAQNETASLQVFNNDSTGSDMDLESEEETNEKEKAMVLSAQPPSPIHKEKAKAEQQKQKQNQGTERLKNLNQQQLQQLQKQTKKIISHQSVNRNIDYKQFVIVNNDWKSFFSKSQNIMCWSSKSRKQCYPAAKRNFPELFNSGWVLLRPEQKKKIPQNTNTTSKKKFYNVFTNVMCDDLSNEITNHLSAKSSLLYRSTIQKKIGTIVRPVMLCQHPVKGRTGCHGPSGKITKACKYCARIRGYK